MAFIDVSHVTFAYPGAPENVFENFSLHFDTDWRLGLVGRNGRGKTTLLRLLAGSIRGSGSVHVPEPLPLFPPPLPPDGASVLRAMRILAPGLEAWEAEAELSRLNVHVSAQEALFDSLSPGERTKVLLAAQFLSGSGFLLIDEPTNHLDAAGRRQLADYLAAQHGFLVASHDRDFLDRCTDHTLALTRTGAEVCRGSFSAWKADFDSRQAAQAARSRQLRRDIERLSGAAADCEQWSRRRERTKSETSDSGFAGRRAAKLMKRAKAAEKRREKAAAEKKSLLRDAESAPALIMRPLTAPQDLLLSFSGAAAAYAGSAPFSPATFEVRRGDRVAIEGGNGTGKTSLLRLIAGDDVPHTGEIIAKGGLIISWLPQDTSGERGTMRDLAARRGLDWTQLAATLRQLGFPRAQLEYSLETLSEGQRKKALLAASLCEQAHLYVWDEPLNYIDIYTRLQLEELITRVRPTLLMIEHDSAFVDAVATKRVCLERSAQPAPVR